MIVVKFKKGGKISPSVTNGLDAPRWSNYESSLKEDLWQMDIVSNPAVSNDTTAASDSLLGTDGTTSSDLTLSADGTPADKSPVGLAHATEESLRVGNVWNTGDKRPRVEVTTTYDGRGVEIYPRWETPTVKTKIPTLV